MTPGHALWVVNGLGGQFGQTVQLNALKGYVRERDGGVSFKCYLSADDCQELAEAFAVLAAALRDRVDFNEEEPQEEQP